MEISSCSFLQRCCLFILLFLLVIAASVVAITFIIIFILKPRKPTFTLQTLTKDSFKLDVSSSSSDVYLSLMASLTMNAQNPNKFSISYTSSRFRVLHRGGTTPLIGIIVIPELYQPACSRNVSVRAELVLNHVSINQITQPSEEEEYSSSNSVNGGNNYLPFRVVGDVRSQVRILDFTLPTVKIAIDCKVNVDYERFILNSAEYSVRRYQKESNVNHPTFSTECSWAVCI